MARNSGLAILACIVWGESLGFWAWVGYSGALFFFGVYTKLKIDKAKSKSSKPVHKPVATEEEGSLVGKDLETGGDDQQHSNHGNQKHSNHGPRE